MDRDRLELLTRVASMYFEQGLTQKEIAERTGYSRSMISRLLAEAQEHEVVEIRVRHTLDRRTDLEDALRQRFGLKAVRVAARGLTDHDQMIARLGSLSARLLEEFVHDGMTIGVSWGTTLLETLNALPHRPLQDIHVVQMVGLLGTDDTQIDGNELARRLARAYNGRYAILPAPLLVDSDATRQALMENERVRRVLQMAAKAELALFGVGTLTLEDCTLYHDGFFSKEQVGDLTTAGAVGDICCIFLNGRGEIVETPLTRRVVTIEHETLLGIPTKIGVAGGHTKIAPMLAAICGGLINALVTDEVGAIGVLDASVDQPSPEPNPSR